jgi:hypothetical protein
MKGIYRLYYRAAVEKRAKRQLRDALSMLENRCLPPRPASAGTDDLQRAMMQMTWWPSRDVLAGLDSSVRELAMLDREKTPKPLWKAFGLVNQRWPGFRLIPRLDILVSRARNRLNEAGEADLTWVRREARGGGEGASEAKRFLADLRKFQKDPRTAAKIEWLRYKRLLFGPDLNKRVQLWCGDEPASLRVRYYARALEIIVDDDFREPLRNNARPLLEWIAHLGNPAYSDVLKRDDFMEWIAERLAERAAQESAARERKQGSERQRRFRARKITR